MSGTIRIPDMPNLGAPSDAAMLVGELSGSGVFTGAQLRSYVLSGTLPAITTGSLTVNGPAAFDGDVGVAGTFTVSGGTHLASDLTVDGNSHMVGNVQADGNVAVGGVVTAAGGLYVDTVSGFGLYNSGGYNLVDFLGGTYIGRNTTTGSLSVAISSVGEVARFEASTGMLLIKGGPTAQLGSFGADGYLVINGTGNFSSGSGGASSLIINGGGRTTYGFEFYSNGARLLAFGGDGSAYKPGGGPWADISDERLKADITDYTAGLAQILQLRPVSYTFKPETKRADTTHYGLIAQEAETVMPEMVTIGPGECGDLAFDDMRTLDTQALIYACMNAIKTLAGNSATADDDIASLQDQISALTARVAALETAPPSPPAAPQA